MLLKRAHFLRLLVVLSLSFIFSSCDPTKSLVSSGFDSDFIILQMNDVYEISPLEGGTTAGMARVATVVKELEKENPHTYVVLSGDFLSPSLIGRLKDENGERIAGMQMVEAMNAVGVDFVTFGNHEFDLSDLETLQKRIDHSDFRFICSNVKKVEGGKAMPFTQMVNGKATEIPPYIIVGIHHPREKTINVGFTGVVLPFNKAEYVEYGPTIPSIAKNVAIMKPEVDVVVALTHLAIDEDKELAEKVPDIDLILGGHDHENMKFKIGKTIITKADANAKTVYIHRVKVNKDGTLDVRSELKKIDNSIAFEPETQKVVKKWEDKLDKILDAQGFDPTEELYLAKAPLICTEASIRNEQTNFGQIAVNAMEAAVPGADFYMINSGSMRLDDNIFGMITAFDILRTFPYGGSIVTVEIPGDRLQHLLDISQLTNKGEGGYMQTMPIELRRDGWAIEGKAIDKTKTYKVVMPKFVAKGNEANLEFLGDLPRAGEEMVTINGKEIKNDIRFIVIEYMKGL